MVSDFFINLVDQYGYWIFYFALSFGPFGIPLPNEVIVTTSGWITGNGGLLPWLVYLCIVSGMITAVTAGFLIGKHFGNPLVEKLRKHRKYGRYIAAAERCFTGIGASLYSSATSSRSSATSCRLWRGQAVSLTGRSPWCRMPAR